MYEEEGGRERINQCQNGGIADHGGLHESVRACVCLFVTEDAI